MKVYSALGDKPVNVVDSVVAANWRPSVWPGSVARAANQLVTPVSDSHSTSMLLVASVPQVGSSGTMAAAEV